MPRNQQRDFSYSPRDGRPNARLSCISLTNFKSVIHQEIRLAPLSVIVGKNSSGKSSLIQSILFLAQNASSPLSHERGDKGILDLNGELVNLGIFKEVRNDRAKLDAPFQIGGKFEFSYHQPMELLSDEDSFSGKNVELTWNISFKPGGSNQDGSLVESTSTNGKLAFESKVFQEFESFESDLKSVEELLSDDEKENNQGLPDLFQGLNIFRKATIKTYGRIVTAADRPGPFSRDDYSSLDSVTNLVGVKYVLGLPVNGLKYANRFEFFMTRQEQYFSSSKVRSDASAILNSLTRRNRITGQLNQASIRTPRLDIQSMDEAIGYYVTAARHFFDSDSRWLSKVDYNRTKSSHVPLHEIPFEIKAQLKTDWGFVEDNQGVIQQFDRDEMNVISFPFNQIESVLPFITFEKEKIAQQVAEKAEIFWSSVAGQIYSKYENSLRKLNNDVLVPASLTDDVARNNAGLDATEFEFGDAVVELEEFLNRVVYLGPLRLEPSDIYGRTQGARNDQLPLGMQGELLARVLSENPLGNYPLPTNSNVVSPGTPIEFTDALMAWLKELGIAQYGISVTSDRHYGFRVQVDNRYLRSLGVGVSQVIPVIAVCLLAQPGSLVMLEEPELHLNPSVQQKLADFFLAMTHSGRQLLVETHSEYLITRLRLRAMQNPDHTGKFNFIFTKQEHETWNDLSANTPYSVYTEVKPSSTGELPEWPEGFFDQVTLDIQALLEEMIKKQNSEEIVPSQDI